MQREANIDTVYCYSFCLFSHRQLTVLKIDVQIHYWTPILACLYIRFTTHGSYIDLVVDNDQWSGCFYLGTAPLANSLALFPVILTLTLFG